MKKKSKIVIAICILASIVLLTSCGGNVLGEFMDQLTLPLETTNHLDFNSEYEYKGKKIDVVWISSNESVISTTGEVNCAETDVLVTLVAIATLDKREQKKSFIVKVPGQDNQQILEKAANTIVFPIRISSDIQIPTSKQVDGMTVSIQWESSNSEILDGTGKVHLPLIDTVIYLKGVFTINKSRYEKEYQVVVIKDPQYNPENLWTNLPIYFDAIPNEAYPEKQSEFPGALYRKVQSSKDYWLGIEVTVTLPEFTGDEKRMDKNPSGSLGDMRYLDNGSVYLGGNASRESDVGLTWSVGASDATATAVDWSQSIAYRPFWRWITSDHKNLYANSKWQDTQFYYYPGDKVRMSVYSPEEGMLQLKIELLEETTIPKYVQRRASFNLGENYEKVFVSAKFESPGMGKYKSSFKRVVAIDQVNNEGKPTCPTNASNIGAIYHECYLYRKVNGQMYKVPFIERRYSAICSPGSTNALGDFTNAFSVTYDGVNKELGGEIVSIDPKNNVK